MLRLRGIAVALAAAGTGVAIAACGASSESASGFGGNGDAGTSFDGGAEDSAAGDTSLITGDASGAADSGDAGAIETGGLFVHASPDLPDLRLCWQVGAGGFSHAPAFPTGTDAPASNYPALPVGGSVPLADASSLVGNDLTIVGIPAGLLHTLEKSGPEYCDDMMKSRTGGTILGGIDIYTFTVPGGIVAGATNVIALAGCPPSAVDPNGTLARCGAGYTAATGNLHVDVLPLYEVSTSDAGQLPVQAAQLSPALAQLVGDAGAAVVSFGAQGATSPVATLTGEGAFGPADASYLNVGTDPTSYGTLGFGVDVTGADGGPGHLWMSLEQSLELVDPMMNPAVYYAKQTTYVVAVVGDPNAAHAFAPDAAFDGTGLHILVLPLP
jgi:hypothetical protein